MIKDGHHSLPEWWSSKVVLKMTEYCGVEYLWDLTLLALRLQWR